MTAGLVTHERHLTRAAFREAAATALVRVGVSPGPPVPRALMARTHV